MICFKGISLCVNLLLSLKLVWRNKSLEIATAPLLILFSIWEEKPLLPEVRKPPINPWVITCLSLGIRTNTDSVGKLAELLFWGPASAPGIRKIRLHPARSFYTSFCRMVGPYVGLQRKIDMAISQSFLAVETWNFVWWALRGNPIYWVS